jgi:hypothetical protein
MTLRVLSIREPDLEHDFGKASSKTPAVNLAAIRKPGRHFHYHILLEEKSI